MNKNSPEPPFYNFFPQQHHTRSKGEQLVLACLLDCFLASLFGFVSAKRTKGKAKAKRERRTAARKKERKKERKTKDQRTKGLADQWTSGLQGTSGPEDRPPTRLGIPRDFIAQRRFFIDSENILFFGGGSVHMFY